MSDIKHLVFTEQIWAFPRVYYIKDADGDAPLFQAVRVGFRQDSLDVFRGSRKTGDKAITIKSRGLFSLTHDIIAPGNDILGTVKRHNPFLDDMTVMDTGTGVVGDLCNTAAALLGGHYHLKINERVVCTLDEKPIFWSHKADMHHQPDVTESINEPLLIAAMLLVLTKIGRSAGMG